MDALARLHDKLTASELSARTPSLRRQAQLVVEGADQACRLPEDRDRVRQAAADLQGSRPDSAELLVGGKTCCLHLEAVFWHP